MQSIWKNYVKEFAFFVKKYNFFVKATNVKRNLIMESFRGISQKIFLDFEWFFYDSFEPQNAAFPEQLLMVGSVWLNKGSLKLTSHGIAHFLWSADLWKTFNQLIMSTSNFSQYFFQ